jgi:cbb3-type cytochrome c oxidase subunit III
MHTLTIWRRISVCLRNRRLVLAFAITVLSSICQAQQVQDAKKLKNPLPKDAESVEAGRKLYQRHCAGCHGPGGKGDGSLALSGGTPSDLTDDTWDHGSTDGEIFTVIRDGVSSDMLAYKDRLEDKQIWQLVNFIRSIGPQGK